MKKPVTCVSNVLRISVYICPIKCTVLRFIFELIAGFMWPTIMSCIMSKHVFSLFSPKTVNLQMFTVAYLSVFSWSTWINWVLMSFAPEKSILYWHVFSWNDSTQIIYYLCLFTPAHVFPLTLYAFKFFHEGVLSDRTYWYKHCFWEHFYTFCLKSY